MELSSRTQASAVDYLPFKIWFVLLVLLFGGRAASALDPMPAATPIAIFQTDQEQLNLVEARYDRWNQRLYQFSIVLGVLAVFGVGCAIWAYRDCRSTVLWFGIGVALNVFSLVAIYMARRRSRGRKRYRRVITYWGVTR